MNRNSIRTDLAIENSEYINRNKDYSNNDIDGVKITVKNHQTNTHIEEISEYNEILVTTVDILNDEGSSNMNKPQGKYITIESKAMKENMIEIHEEISEILALQLGATHNFTDETKILVIGLGNWNITPDALGPKVTEKILVTRHIKDSLPTELSGQLRSVSALSPGVMGITGMETVEIVKGLVDKTNPTLLICIDALAARKTNRINTTIQISDSGINPGSGIGNHRKALNKETLGIPVIAIGVPTVVDAATLASDTIDKMLESMTHELEIQYSETNRVFGEYNEFFSMLKNLQDDEKYYVIKEILDPYEENMFVTPKDVDIIIDRLSTIISNALNIVMHPGITKSDINRYIM